MRSYFEEGFQILQDSGEEGKRLLGYSLSQYAVALIDRDPTLAQSVAEEGIQASRETGDLLGLACSLFALGMVARRLEDYEEAGALLSRSLAYHRDQGLIIDLHYLGLYELSIGNLEEANSYQREGVALAKEANLRFWFRFLFDALGYLACARNPDRAATVWCRREAARAIGDRALSIRAGRIRKIH